MEHRKKGVKVVHETGETVCLLSKFPIASLLHMVDESELMAENYGR